MGGECKYYYHFDVCTFLLQQLVFMNEWYRSTPFMRSPAAVLGTSKQRAYSARDAAAEEVPPEVHQAMKEAMYRRIARFDGRSLPLPAAGSIEEQRAKQISQQATSIILRLLQPHSADRLSAVAVNQSAWLQS